MGFWTFGKPDQAGQCLHFSQILLVRTVCQVPTTIRDLTPLALHYNQHLSGLETERMGPISHILLEISGYLAIPQRRILISFFCQILERGKALAACQGSACDRGFGGCHTSALKNTDIPNVIVSGLLLTGEVSKASLSYQHCLGKSGSIKAQPLKPPTPALSPSLQYLVVPLTSSSYRFHIGKKPSNFTAVPCALPTTIVSPPLHSPKTAAASGHGADGGWTLLFPLHLLA